ncbi:FKBP-type peptidyl-prolyl cis-trans isomerase [Leucobacter sp. HY1908]
MNITRALLPAALAGALLVTGCSAGGGTGGDVTKDAAGKECLAAGDASKAIKISGEVGTDAKITSKTPIKVKDMQRTVLKAGEGKAIESGQTTSVAMSVLNGRDGSEVEKAPATDAAYQTGAYSGWLEEAMRCAVSGQQVAVVAPYAEVFGETKPADLPVKGVKDTDSFVFLLEFGEISDTPAATNEPGTLEMEDLLKKAEGKAKAAPEGFPTVKLAKNGEPTITIPEGVKAPEKLEIATVIEGDGETVEPGDRVYVNYRGVIWSTGEEFDSSWSRGEPAMFTTNGVIGGFQKALEGQKVGSQIISVVPAEDGGYGAAQLESMGHKPDDVMVFVLDILGTVHAE